MSFEADRVDVPKYGVAHRAGEPGVFVVTAGTTTKCFECGAEIAAGAVCTRSGDKKGTVGGIRYTRCTTCVPVVFTADVRRAPPGELMAMLSFRTRENAVAFAQALEDLRLPGSVTLYLDGDELALRLGVTLPDLP
ncbi:hypothetical protein [Deinococcus sonorensis]|uniref:CENP-V/GFA domain-containing protein n=2 Tax=Deinococcus sonorensis TaxID=309891 RepID=A0AAU7UHG0_9DEIO